MENETRDGPESGPGDERTDLTAFERVAFELWEYDGIEEVCRVLDTGDTAVEVSLSEGSSFPSGELAEQGWIVSEIDTFYGGSPTVVRLTYDPSSESASASADD